jgi:hypothetical protein
MTAPVDDDGLDHVGFVVVGRSEASLLAHPQKYGNSAEQTMTMTKS